MQNLSIVAYQTGQTADGVDRRLKLDFNDGEMAKVKNVESAVATSVERVLVFLKAMREMDAKHDLQSNKPVYFQIVKKGVPLVDTATFNETMTASVKLPVNTPESRAKFRKRLRVLMQFAWSDIVVVKNFDEWQNVEAIPARANG
jgi:hypothetical protein